MRAFTFFSSLTSLSLILTGCSLFSIDPDEIDVADEVGDESSGLDDSGASETGTFETGTTGTEDGSDTSDASSADTADTADTSGTTDTTDTAGTTDTTDTSSDSGDTSCESLDPQVFEAADNMVDLAGDSSFMASCGGASGPEVLGSFTAEIDAIYQFEISLNEFEAVIYLAGPSCDPLDELDCAVAPDVLQKSMVAGEVVYVFVDSNGGPGSAVLTIAAL